MKECTHGAYIVLICQPEATFDYLIVVQLKKLSNENIILFNKRYNSSYIIRYVVLVSKQLISQPQSCLSL